MEDCIDCGNCYEMDGVSCYSILTVIAGLTPATTYCAFVEDRHGNQYTQSVTTDADGDFTLDLTAFPDGMFTSVSGCYTITASTSFLTSTEEIMTVGYREYSCIKVKFIDIS